MSQFGYQRGIIDRSGRGPQSSVSRGEAFHYRENSNVGNVKKRDIGMY